MVAEATGAGDDTLLADGVGVGLGVGVFVAEGVEVGELVLVELGNGVDVLPPEPNAAEDPTTSKTTDTASTMLAAFRFIMRAQVFLPVTREKRAVGKISKKRRKKATAALEAPMRTIIAIAPIPTQVETVGLNQFFIEIPPNRCCFSELLQRLVRKF
jgi:hypothetical protein